MEGVGVGWVDGTRRTIEQGTVAWQYCMHLGAKGPHVRRKEGEAVGDTRITSEGPVCASSNNGRLAFHEPLHQRPSQLGMHPPRALYGVLDGLRRWDQLRLGLASRCCASRTGEGIEKLDSPAPPRPPLLGLSSTAQRPGPARARQILARAPLARAGRH